MIDHLAADFSGKVTVFNLTNVELCIPEQAGAVRLYCTYMVGVLMGDEDVPDGLGIDLQPAHFFFQTVVVVPGIDHDGGVALAIEKDVGHPLPHAGHVLIHPARVQGLEDLLAPVHLAHGFSLKLGRFL